MAEATGAEVAPDGATAPDPRPVADEIVRGILGRVADDRLDFGSFLVGLRFESRDLARDGRLEPFRADVKRLVTEGLRVAWPERRVELRAPDATFVHDLDRRRLAVQLKALHVYGRYRKHARGIPQTVLECARCWGRGCRLCRGRGRTVRESVEEWLGGAVARAFRASRRPILHGMGREDTDVLTLGDGRPFVLEVRDPRARSADLEAAALSVAEGSRGRVSVAGPLRLVDAECVTRVKQAQPPKRYRALARAEGPIDPARAAALPGLFSGIALEQKTPERVAHRRADIVRPRRVLSLAVLRVSEQELELDLTTEAGTYVKELVSGDGGRTVPSIASSLGVAIRVVELDVTGVLARDEDVLGAPGSAP